MKNIILSLVSTKDSARSTIDVKTQFRINSHQKIDQFLAINTFSNKQMQVEAHDIKLLC